MERLALFWPNFNLHFLSNCHYFYFSNREKLLLHHHGSNSKYWYGTINQERIRGNTRSHWCSWSAHLEFKARQKSVDRPCFRKRWSRKRSSHKFDRNLSAQENIPLNFAGVRRKLEKPWGVHSLRSGHPLINYVREKRIYRLIQFVELILIDLDHKLKSKYKKKHL